MSSRSLAGAAPAAPAPPSTWAVVALVLVNVLPLLGVVVFDWRLSDLMRLYWLENGVIGAFTLLKILTAAPTGGAARIGTVDIVARLGVGGFFILHYGLFWVVHGVFVLLLFEGGGTVFGGGPFSAGDPLPPDAAGAAGATVTLALLSLVVSHGVSYVTNFLGRGEDRALGPQELMAQPYGRVVVLHVTIIGGGFVALALGTPLAALVLLVVLKTAVDLSAHLREHVGALTPRRRA